MPLDQMQQDFALALHDTARAWRHALDRRLKGLGLSQASWMSIAYLAKASEPLTQTELAHCLSVEQPTVVAMLDRLQRAGLIRREVDSHDRRMRRIRLTNEGAEVYTEVQRVAQAFRREKLQDMDAEMLRQMTRLLLDLQQRLEEPGA
ncbi:MarR family transcriptional regulator [Acidithiobacillus montserratensis]|uniref:MarR family transcriptional regulator n=1 Tax=Acidithiobacillus montserratensis TaxID=2729135 RepID=A0ACD5HG83_9PROT|nr:MarR family transcriptional regulator [Acidithiobacillus montserratensis]MBN2678605.1 MarR family transcriptional regulator [Acidithiobacillaceae bacterium]MBU2748801.1 MarR family transcriptional regulator [Acidithiobacillus montserratensis]